MVESTERQFEVFEESGLEPERITMPVNGHAEGKRVYAEDGRRLILISRTEGGLGDFVAIDDEAFEIASIPCHSLEAKSNNKSMYERAGWSVFDTEDSCLRLIAYMDKEKYKAIMSELARQQLEEKNLI